MVSYSVDGTTRSEFQGRTKEATYQWDLVDEGHFQGAIISDGVTIDFVVDGDDQYAKGAPPGVGVGIENQSILSRPVPSRQSTIDLLGSLGTVEELPNETLDGADSLRRRGEIDMERLIDGLIEQYRAEQPGPYDFTGIDTQRAAEVSVDLWIDSETFYITRLVMDMRLLTTTQHGDGTTSVEFMQALTDARYSRFNETIELELPVDASGNLLPGWQAAGATDNQGGVVVEQRLVGE